MRMCPIFYRVHRSDRPCPLPIEAVVEGEVAAAVAAAAAVGRAAPVAEVVEEEAGEGEAGEGAEVAGGGGGQEAQGERAVQVAKLAAVVGMGETVEGRGGT